jgi:hypothetical protein
MLKHQIITLETAAHCIKGTFCTAVKKLIGHCFYPTVLVQGQ